VEHYREAQPNSLRSCTESGIKFVGARAPKVLDTFAGAGGFSLGLHLAGFQVTGGIEIDSWACETFSKNHSSAQVLCRDISSVTDDELRSRFSGSAAPDVIVGGPPCQGFSIANKNAGDFKDPRNSLFRDFVRTGRVLQPALMIMENVPNLLAARTTDQVLVIDIIRDALRDIGYHVQWKVLNATDFGVPQIRSRLFVVASRSPIDNPWPSPTHTVLASTQRALFGQTLPACPTLWDAISDLPPLAAREGAEEQEYTESPRTPYQETMRLDSTKLFNHKAMNHGGRMVQRFASMKCGESGNDVPDELKARRRNSQEIAKVVYDQNNRRMFPFRQCHTIAASFYANFVHPYQHRNFTAREGARIQSFPDWFRFLGKPTVVSHKLLAREERHHERFLCQYAQIGNAVPPHLARTLGEHLLNNSKDLTECLYMATT
jgi:DNA (cytosine-5)-methyltransferase 1